MNNNINDNVNREIDLGYLFNKVNNLFKGFLVYIFSIFAFFRKYIILIVILLLLAFGWGFYKDLNDEPIFKNELIVIPNFESTEYLYQEVTDLNLKREAEDTLFLKGIIGKNYKDFLKMEIKPFVDIYAFMTKNKDNIEVMKILYSEKDKEDFLTNNALSKYYKYHNITIKTKGVGSKDVCEKLMAYLNSNRHFKMYREVGLVDTEIKIEQNQKMINQIDSILKQIASAPIKGANDQSVFISDQSDLYQMINTKQALLNLRFDLQKKKVDEADIIKVVSGNYNLKQEKLIDISNKVKFPLYILMLFVIIFLILSFYKWANRMAFN